MLLNIDLEKKLNELNEGTYYKTLNGKTYEIVVKNIESDTKTINVYYNKKLIFESNYYKDGKIKKEGIEMRDDYNNYTLNDIIEKMISLSEGYAQLENMSICVKESKKIDSMSSTSFKVEIEDEMNFYTFNIPFTNEYYIDIKSKDNAFEVYTKKDKTSVEKDNRSITFVDKDKKYSIVKNVLTNLNDDKKYFVHNNTLMYKIDENNYIGYSFENDKVYIYTKKTNAVNNDIDNDFSKIIYTKNVAKASSVCNGILNVLKNKVKETVNDKDLNGLIDNIKLPKLDCNYDNYYDEIIEVAGLYKTHINNLNMLDDESIINSIYNLVVNANITIVDKKIYDFKQNINTNSLKDLNTLYELRKQLREIIKLKKKQNRTKKKILTNTDIEN